VTAKTRFIEDSHLVVQVLPELFIGQVQRLAPRQADAASATLGEASFDDQLLLIVVTTTPSSLSVRR
jgi:hypothetical protein